MDDWNPASLMKLSVEDLKKMADEAGTPTTGSKSVLVDRILNPASHKRKKAKAGLQKERAPKKKAPTSIFASDDEGLDSDTEVIEEPEVVALNAAHGPWSAAAVSAQAKGLRAPGGHFKLSNNGR